MLTIPELYTITTAAKYLKLKPVTLKKRQQRGTLTGIRYGREWLFTKEQLDASNVATPPSGRKKFLDYQEVMDLIEREYTKTEIAKQFGVTQSAVSKLVARHRSAKPRKIKRAKRRMP